MAKRGLLGLLGLSLLAGASSPALGRSLGRTTFVDKNAGIRLFLPAGWVAQERSALPGLVVAFRHPSGGRLVLSTRNRRPEETASSLAAEHLEPLRRQGYSVNPPVTTQIGTVPAVLLEATDSGNRQHVYQIYALRGKLAYVLTMTAPAKHRARLEADLRFLQKTTRFAE